MPAISIITINFNDCAGLERTLSSVAGQSFRDFEHIVIDGGSNDGSVDLLSKWRDKLAYAVSEKDKGIYNAQNKGAKEAKGKYLLFLNSGDVLADEHVLKEVAGELSEELVYGDLLVDTESKIETAVMPEKLSVYFFMIASLAHPATFISTSLFRKLNGYREELKITADHEFFIRAALVHNCSYKHIARAISVFNTGGVSSDPENDEKQKRERRLSWEMNFSPLVLQAMEEYTSLLRSSELRMGKLVKKVISPFRTR